jgi:hypothetical protein
VFILTSEEQRIFLSELSTPFAYKMIADLDIPMQLVTSFTMHTLQDAIKVLNHSNSIQDLPDMEKYIVRRSTCNPKKIVFFGASVTAQTYSYMDSLQLPNTELIKKGYGGCHINQATWLLQDVLDLKPDVCVLDWITSLISTRSELEKYLDSIVWRLKEHGIVPIFLYLYRRSIKDFKETIQVYESVANYYAITSVHMYGLIEELRPNLDELFRDECHTTFAGSQYYGNALSTLFTSETKPKPRLFPENPYDGVQSFTISDPSSETMVFNGITYTKITDSLPLNLPNAKILALHILYHPAAGRIEIGDKTFQTWDSNCYYIRRGYHNLFCSGPSIRIQQDSFETPCKHECIFPEQKYMWISEVLYLTSFP